MNPPVGDSADTRAELVRLLQRHAVEALRLGRVFSERHDLHPTDWWALLAVVQGVRSGTPLTPGQLGSRLTMSSGATTAVVDRLERAGHLHRRRDPRDRRRLTLHCAENAPALLAAFFDPLEAAMDVAVADYTAPELDAARRFLADALDRVIDQRMRLSEG